MDWQPIETAPKDGTQVIIWNGDRVLAAHFDCAWYAATDVYDSDPYGPIVMSPAPTHWMPLPSPPAIAMETGTAIDSEAGEAMTARAVGIARTIRKFRIVRS